MSATTTAIRAIGACYAQQLFWWVAGYFIGAVILIGSGIIWLTTISGWWWLLFLVFMVAACVGAGLLGVFYLLSRYVTPKQTAEQRAAVKQFITKLRATADVVGTPKIILLFRLVRSIAAPSQKNYLQTLCEQTGSLQKDFANIISLF